MSIEERRRWLGTAAIAIALAVYTHAENEATRRTFDSAVTAAKAAESAASAAETASTSAEEEAQAAKSSADDAQSTAQEAVDAISNLPQ